MAASGSFFVTISCVIRGYHVYKEVWSPNIGENFVCFDEEENVHDRKAVERVTRRFFACSLLCWPLTCVTRWLEPLHKHWPR